jgi:hypothetical protein
MTKNTVIWSDASNAYLSAPLSVSPVAFADMRRKLARMFDITILNARTEVLDRVTHVTKYTPVILKTDCLIVFGDWKESATAVAEVLLASALGKPVIYVAERSHAKHGAVAYLADVTVDPKGVVTNLTYEH